MATIIVMTDERERSDAHVLRDEQFHPDHLADERAQLTERLSWTMVDAEPSKRRVASQVSSPARAASR